MKILHTTDLHFNKNHFDWIKEQSDKFDIFCISGDFLDTSQNETLSYQIEWISLWINAFKKPLFVCSGNHDIEEFDNENWLCNIDTSKLYTDNTKKIINGVTFGCYPFIGGDGYLDFEDCDVLIIHTPPAHSKTSTDVNHNDWGEEELYRTIMDNLIAPKIILCGHMHQPIETIDKIRNTLIYNPGVNHDNKIPNYHIVEI